MSKMFIKAFCLLESQTKKSQGPYKNPERREMQTLSFETPGDGADPLLGASK